MTVPYFWWRSPSWDRDLVLPLFYSSRRYEVSGSTATGFKRGEQSGRYAVVFPLYWSGRDAEHEYRYFLPLYAHDADGLRRWTNAGLIWVSYHGPEGRRFRVLFPLYWRYRSADAPSAVNPAVPEHRDVAVWGPAYRVDLWRGDRRTRTVGLAPFFSRTYTDENDKYFEVLGGLFGRDVQEGKRRFRILWLFYTPAK
jgi:hypothetical protein